MGIILLILPFLVAYLIINALIQPQKIIKYGWTLTQCTYAMGLAMGMSSYIYCGALRFIDYSKFNFMLAEVVFLSILTVIALLFRRSNSKRQATEETAILGLEESSSTLPAFIQIGFLGVLVVFLLHYLFIVLNNPHGGWDAWFIWNTRARLLFRSESQWLSYFTDRFQESHLDYPLLLPINIARMWQYLGKETLLAPNGIAFLFTIATLILLVSSLSILKSRAQGIMAGTTLLTISFFTEHGASQFADTPLGFYLLTIITLIYVKDRLGSSGNHRGMGVLCGIFIGFAAWTKNEGLLLILVVILVFISYALIYRAGRPLIDDLMPILIGLAPMAALLIYYKAALVPPNDIMSHQSFSSTLQKLTTISRYKVVAEGYFSYGLKLFKGNLVIFPVYLYLFGRMKQRVYSKSNYLSIAIIGLLLTGYFFIYVISPHDLAWHLLTSLKRLYIQVLPSAILVFFVLAETPSGYLKRVSDNHPKMKSTPVDGNIPVYGDINL